MLVVSIMNLAILNTYSSLENSRGRKKLFSTDTEFIDWEVDRANIFTLWCSTYGKNLMGICWINK
jgi:hypothetical protein